MYVRELQLRDFRSWENVQLQLTAGVTVFMGRNGYGKTNLVEALRYCGSLSSHRVATDAPLIRSGADRAVVSAIAVREGRELAVDIEIVAGRANRARINRSPVRSPREVLGIVNTVLFAPEDLSLVRGDPGERRRFLDELLIARYPRFAGVKADYDKVLRQRSALLKTAAAALRRGGPDTVHSTLDVWDEQLSLYGAELIVARNTLVDELNPLLRKAYSEIAPQSRPAHARYRGSVEALPDQIGDVAAVSRVFLETLNAMRGKEIERGVCLVGPHRDDLELSLGVDPAKSFASHGESWSYALSLRLASFELLREVGTDPILVLDDVFAELDRARRRCLSAVAAQAEQTIITAAVAEDVPTELGGHTFVVDIVEDGERRTSHITPHAVGADHD